VPPERQHAGEAPVREVDAQAARHEPYRRRHGAKAARYLHINAHWAEIHRLANRQALVFGPTFGEPNARTSSAQGARWHPKARSLTSHIGGGAGLVDSAIEKCE